MLELDGVMKQVATDSLKKNSYLPETGKRKIDQREDDFTSGYGSWLQPNNRKAVMLDKFIEYVSGTS
ncbi:hypothetical protein Bca4012_010607 [Brassica carinata]